MKMSESIADISIPGVSSYSDSLAAAANRPLLNNNNPIVFLDIAIGGHNMGRIKIELFKHIMPKCSENFRQFCTGKYAILYLLCYLYIVHLISFQMRCYTVYLMMYLMVYYMVYMVYGE